MSEKKPTRQAEIVFAAMKAIEANGGEMRISDIYETLASSFPLTDYEKEETKSGVIRWKAYLNFYSIEVGKVGYLVKKSGIWHLTEEGAKALAAGAGEFFADFHGKFSKIQKEHAVSVIEENADQPDDLDMLQGQASKGIREYIIKKNPYEFQDLVAALLRAMGYYTPFIAPKGKDGGVDIIAYRDPLGTTAPQLKVQVKHYPTSAISVDVVRSLLGVLVKEGAKALAAGAGEFFADFHGKFSKIQKEHAVSVIEENADQPDDLDMLQGQASKGIREYIIKKNPYEFQDLVAALLRAMGYYTPFIAPKGKDGGVDIIAYRDPLGTTAPQLKVQVKHYPTSAISVDVVRSLLGVLVKEGEVGLLVTSGTFTSESKKEARNGHRCLRLIDIDEFIDLWIRYYDRMSEEDKALLPIIPVYFLKA